MYTVKLGDTVIAQSETAEMVENNYYLPPTALKKELFSDSDTHTTCPWKGVASYYNLEADGLTVKDVAWYYPNPKEAANNIKDYVAFYKNKVRVLKD